MPIHKIIVTITVNKLLDNEQLKLNLPILKIDNFFISIFKSKFCRSNPIRIKNFRKCMPGINTPAYYAAASMTKYFHGRGYSGSSISALSQE